MSKEKVLTLDNVQEGEELIKRTEVRDTPFVIIETDGKIFGTFGKYRITEGYDSPDEEKKGELYKELEGITWNRLLQVIGIMIEEQEELKKLLNDES